jgi:hypothetical protein
VGVLTVNPPEQRLGEWVCAVVHRDRKETVLRPFGAGPDGKAKALEWYTTQALAASHTLPSRPEVPLAAGRGQARRTCAALDDEDEHTSVAAGLAAEAGYQQPITAQAASGKQLSDVGKKRYGLRVGRVREVLEEYGLDPTAELAKVLLKRKPLFDRKTGQPLLDEHGVQLTEPVLDEKTATGVLIDLQQYVAPKLKAVEVIQKDDLPESVEEVDSRINRLIELRQLLNAGAVR